MASLKKVGASKSLEIAKWNFQSGVLSKKYIALVNTTQFNPCSKQIAGKCNSFWL